MGRKIAILIVIYNREISSVTTINELASFAHIFPPDAGTFYIWNNGPKKLEFSSQDLQAIRKKIGAPIVLKETTDNWPLSKIYNKFMEECSADTYLFFDHDSHPSEAFIRALLDESSASEDVCIPRIIVKGKVQGPHLNGTIVTDDRVINLKGSDLFLCISSGLAVNLSLAKRLKEKYGRIFDENYSLYGIDTSFCLRLAELAVRSTVSIKCSGTMTHSLSRLENESEKMAAFRRKERGLDFGITIRRYPRIHWIRRLASIVFRRLFRRKRNDGGIPSLRWICYGFVSGIHPKSKQKISTSNDV